MPDIATFHPQIVHFVIGLLYAGVALRLVSLTGRLRFSGPAATLLIIAGTVAAVLAVQSGTQAHEPVEDTPGSREAVQEHEEWGERTRNLFLVVAALEIAGLAVAGSDKRRRAAKALRIASAAVGVVGLFVLFEAGEHGGELVFAHAGGVGIRSGDPEDVRSLLLAGLYHQAELDRKDGRLEDAARLTEEMARRFPDDPAIQLVAVESLIHDRRDGNAALAAIARIPNPDGDVNLRIRKALLAADAWEVIGQPDSTRTILKRLQAEFPENRRIQRRVGDVNGQH